ncbi:MAG: chemotaxis protein CheA [Proteobacteria bacterium]|nr:chemotaxis protein CheA [Pseudomonadota bacterium]
MTQHEEDREMVQGFVADGHELLDELDPDLIELHKSCEAGGSVDSDKLNAVFRLFHSLKGAAGFLNLHNVARLTHEVEGMLNIVRDGRIMLTTARTDVLCRACDFVRSLLQAIEEQGHDRGFEDRVNSFAEEFTAAAFDESPSAAQAPDAQQQSGMTITPEMRQNYIQESDEMLETVEQSLLEIDRSGNRQESLDTAFRCIHSFKGNCGFMGLADLERLSHCIENVLECMKSGATASTDQNISIIMRTMDSIRSAVADVSNGGTGLIKGCDLMVDLLHGLTPALDVDSKKLKLGEILVARGIASASEVDTALKLQGKTFDEILLDESPSQADATESAFAEQDRMGIRKIFRRDIRVDLDKLDLLMDLVGEMVIAQMMVIHNTDLRGKGYDLDNFEKSCHHLERISTDLQDVALAIRMVPLTTTFRKMIRLVHDLAIKFSKKVRLELKGEETEVDKTVIEHISDPLVHIIRNAIDHGMETPERRRELGKDETGVIVLDARYDGGDVVILISDDGAGLSRERIVKKSLATGLLRGNPDAVKDEDLYSLIFEPGFTTAELVTDVSGRGVGLDVVKRNLEKIRGRVDIKSAPDRGTTFILHIPLTLAIIEGMLVRVGQSKYIIPLLAIMESFRPHEQHITVLPNGTEMVKVRDALLQVSRLYRLHAIQPDTEILHEGILVVVENQGERLCLFVDQVIGQIQTVIKGLPDYIGDVEGLSGCCIMGDGEVCLILDIDSLIKKAKAEVHEG